jgi:hypothetical protein
MERMIDTHQLADWISQSPGTLANWRSRRIGPPYVKLPSGVRYRVRDVEAWLDAQLVEPRSGVR